MKRIAKMYNSEERDLILKMSTRCDKRGNVFVCVEFGDDYFTFSNMVSALDFVNMNFVQ